MEKIIFVKITGLVSRNEAGEDDFDNVQAAVMDAVKTSLTGGNKTLRQKVKFSWEKGEYIAEMKIGVLIPSDNEKRIKI